MQTILKADDFISTILIEIIYFYSSRSFLDLVLPIIERKYYYNLLFVKNNGQGSSVG